MHIYTYGYLYIGIYTDKYIQININISVSEHIRNCSTYKKLWVLRVIDSYNQVGPFRPWIQISKFVFRCCSLLCLLFLPFWCKSNKHYSAIIQIRREKTGAGAWGGTKKNHMWNCAQESYVDSILVVTTGTLALPCTVFLWLMLLYCIKCHVQHCLKLF